jgi:hypothetical protein
MLKSIAVAVLLVLLLAGCSGPKEPKVIDYGYSFWPGWWPGDDWTFTNGHQDLGITVLATDRKLEGEQQYLYQMRLGEPHLAHLRTETFQRQYLWADTVGFDCSTCPGGPGPDPAHRLDSLKFVDFANIRTPWNDTTNATLWGELVELTVNGHVEPHVMIDSPYLGQRRTFPIVLQYDATCKSQACMDRARDTEDPRDALHAKLTLYWDDVLDAPLKWVVEGGIDAATVLSHGSPYYHPELAGDVWWLKRYTRSDDPRQKSEKAIHEKYGGPDHEPPDLPTDQAIQYSIERNDALYDETKPFTRPLSLWTRTPDGRFSEGLMLNFRIVDRRGDTVLDIQKPIHDIPEYKELSRIWRIWNYTWEAPGPGLFKVGLRAISAEGVVRSSYERVWYTQGTTNHTIECDYAIEALGPCGTLQVPMEQEVELTIIFERLDDPLHAENRLTLWDYAGTEVYNHTATGPGDGRIDFTAGDLRDFAFGGNWTLSWFPKLATDAAAKLTFMYWHHPNATISVSAFND